MKFPLHFLLLLLFCNLVITTSCDRDENNIDQFTQLQPGDGPFDGVYDATRYVTSDYYENGSVRATANDTFSFKVIIAENQFQAPTTLNQEKEPCFGAFSSTEDQLNFQSGECSCWCDCNPNVDCGGHPILGEQFFESNAGNLTLRGESDLRDTSYYPNGSFFRVSERRIKLILIE